MKLARLNRRIDTIVSEGGEPNVINVVQKNGVALQVNNKTVNVTVPTKTSDLTNDSGYVTNAVTSVNGQTGAVNLSIPTKTSDLTNDSGFITSFNGVEDVTVDGTSVVTNKVAEIPLAKYNQYGLVKSQKVTEANQMILEYSDGLYSVNIPVLDSNGKILSRYLPTVSSGSVVHYGTTYSTESEATKSITLNPVRRTFALGDLLILHPMYNSGTASITFSFTNLSDTFNVGYLRWNASDNILFYFNGTTFVYLYNLDKTWMYNTKNGTLRVGSTNYTEAQLTKAVGLDPYTKTEVDNLIDGVEAQIPTVPTNVSAFTNDSGYITSSDLSGYANVIESVKVNGDALTVTNKAVDVQVPVRSAYSTNAIVSGDDTYQADLVFLGIKRLLPPQNTSYTTESVYVPKVTVTNGKIGIDSRLLSDYYTKTEIDSMVGDIESLLGAI